MSTSGNTSANQGSNNDGNGDNLSHLSSQLPARTRRAQIRLSATLRQLTRGQILNQLKNTAVNNEVAVTYADPPLWHEQTFIGKIIAIDGPARLVKTASGDIHKIPFTNDRIITEVVITKQSALNVPINHCNAESIDPSLTTIFLDGGSRPNPGPSASAIVLRSIGTDLRVTEENHSQYFPLATNNIAEGIALLAALRLAHRILDNGASKINVVTDSEAAYKILLGISKVEDPKLTPIFKIARETFLPIAGKITIATMRREHGNPADQICTAAIMKGKGEGDANLFIDPPVLPRPVKVANKPPADTPYIPSKFEIPADEVQFQSIHRFKVRSKVPTACIPLWTHIFRHHLQAWADAPSNAEKEEAFIRILLLPHVYLPQNAATHKIQRRMELGVPFNISHQSASNRQERQFDDRIKRQVEAINHLVDDHKLRTANRLLQTSASGDEIPFNEKVNKMKEKVVEDEFKSTIEIKSIPIISGHEIAAALKKINKQSALAIDGLSKEHLSAAIQTDPEIASMIGVLLTWVVSNPVSDKLRRIITMSRGVVLPKDDGGARPICMSGILLKLLGGICMMRDGSKPSHMQYAIGYEDGHKRVVHKVFNHIDKGAAVVKIDCKNAFGMMPRRIIQEQLATADESLRQYFRLVYGSASNICIYGPDQNTLIQLGDGIKQGDATSSFFFCLGLDKALFNISSACRELGIHMSIYAYMDDITICCKPEDIDRIMSIATESLIRIGLQVNRQKSKVLTDHFNEEPFIVLGANLNLNPVSQAAYARNVIARQEKYFALLRQLPLHPQIHFHLLRICGAPRILYQCCVTPPDTFGEVTGYFDATIKDHLKTILDPSGQVFIPEDTLHSVQGAGMPNYHMNRHTLWSATKQMALSDDPNAVRIPLTTTSELTVAHPGSQVDAHWLFYESSNKLTPAQFSTALAIKLGIHRRQDSMEGSKCNCGHIYDNSNTHEHIFTCDMATPFGHTYRHNLVRDAITDVIRKFGITCTKEPTCFTYDDGKKHRPDVLAHTTPMKMAIDVSLIHSGANMQNAEKEKTERHSKACGKSNTVFYPFVMFTRGTLGPKAEAFIRSISNYVQPCMQQAFIKDLQHSVATAAAKGRADALTAAVMRQHW